jgi:hypothetical protein
MDLPTAASRHRVESHAKSRAGVRKVNRPHVREFYRAPSAIEVIAVGRGSFGRSPETCRPKNPDQRRALKPVIAGGRRLRVVRFRFWEIGGQD